MFALIKSAIKLIERTGTNTNQVAKHINEQQKMSPYSLRAADLLPFGQFCEDTDKIRQMLTYLYNMIISGNDSQEAQRCVRRRFPRRSI